MQKTILVTGGAGYIGSACVDSLVKAGHKVVVFDDLSTGQADKVSSEAVLIKGSINDTDALEQVCDKYKFDAVMHFAAKKAVGESEDNPSLYFENNVVGSLNILRIMEKYGISQIIFSSTAAVYDPTHTASFTEEISTAPMSVYGATKLMAEDIIRTYARTDKIKNYTILRYFNVAGDVGLNYKEDNAQNVFPVIARTINNDTEFTVFGNDYDTIDGTCVRDYIHLKDLVAAHVSALEVNENGLYNLGNGKGFTVRQLIEAFNEQLEKTIKIKDMERRRGDCPIVVSDATQAKQKLNWQPKHSLAEMVEDTLRVYGS